MGTFDLLALMAASLRAGKSGPRAKAWHEALNEALFGLGMLQANHDKLVAALASMNERAKPTPSLIQSPTPGDVMAVNGT